MHRINYLKSLFFLEVDGSHLFHDFVPLFSIKQVHEVSVGHDVIDERFAFGPLEFDVGADEDAPLVVVSRCNQS